VLIEIASVLHSRLGLTRYRCQGAKELTLTDPSVLVLTMHRDHN
jgi:hypothetical protein